MVLGLSCVRELTLLRVIYFPLNVRGADLDLKYNNTSATEASVQGYG